MFEIILDISSWNLYKIHEQIKINKLNSIYLKIQGLTPYLGMSKKFVPTGIRG